MTSRARQAARLGQDDPIALSVSGCVLAQVEGDLNAGAALLDRALTTRAKFGGGLAPQRMGTALPRPGEDSD